MNKEEKNQSLDRSEEKEAEEEKEKEILFSEKAFEDSLDFEADLDDLPL